MSRKAQNICKGRKKDPESCQAQPGRKNEDVGSWGAREEGAGRQEEQHRVEHLPRTDILLGRMVTAPSATSSRCSTGALLEPQLSEPTQKKWPVWLAFRAACSTRLWGQHPTWQLAPELPLDPSPPHQGTACTPTRPTWTQGSSSVLPHP